MCPDVVGLLTASRHGIGDDEMEEMLSMNDDVLQEVYLIHIPPDEECIRLPPLLWTRIQYQLKEYLVKTYVNGKEVVSWYHKQVKEVAQDRYVHQSDDLQYSLHDTMADYFLGSWHNVLKPLDVDDVSYPNALRMVSAQPNSFGTSQINRRKISELPYHLVQSCRFTDFVNFICRDIDFMYYKCLASSMSALWTDLRYAIQMIDIQHLQKEYAAEQDEITSLHDVLILCNDVIWKDPKHFPAQVNNNYIRIG